MKKSLSIITPLLIAAGIGLYIWSSMKAKQEQEEILANFKSIDEDLNLSKDSATLNISDKNIQEVYISSSLKSQIILLIDSLKEKYSLLSNDSGKSNSTTAFHPDLKRLLNYMQEYNEWQRTAVDSATPDTIMFNLTSNKFNEKKWLDEFENVPGYVSNTHLIYIRNQLIK